MPDAYDDTFRQDIVALRDSVETDLVAAGLIMREIEVKLCTVTTTGADDARGTPGTDAVTRVVLAPRPKADLRAQWRTIDGATTRLGDALLTVSRGALTLAQIEGAAWFEIAGERFTLVEGQIKQEPLVWKVILKRETQS